MRRQQVPKDSPARFGPKNFKPLILADACENSRDDFCNTMGSRHSCPPTGVPGFVGGLETCATVTYSLRHETCSKLQG
jgi:hypothetical protein